MAHDQFIEYRAKNLARTLAQAQKRRDFLVIVCPPLGVLRYVLSVTTLSREGGCQEVNLALDK